MTPKRARDSAVLPSPAKRAKTGQTRKGKAKNERSIWNSTDDWDTLIADSQLSTSSISLRPARPRGLQSLADCAVVASARGFKGFWEWDKEEWKFWWDVVPDHLKEKVREKVFSRWGSWLNFDIVKEVFSVPPTLHLPGDLLPSVAQSKSFKIFDSLDGVHKTYRSLVLTHSTQASDKAIARLIYFMPNLEVVNLKGCSLVREVTIKKMLERCPNIRRINLKGTNVKEGDVKLLLRRYGKQLEGFKVDNIDFKCVHPASIGDTSKDPVAVGTNEKSPAKKGKKTEKDTSETFDSQPYDKMTHLCLPGDIIVTSKGRTKAGTGYPIPRPAPLDTHFDWSKYGDIFPALTHLYLPGLLIPPGTIINLRPHQLIKFSLGPDGPPVPMSTLTHLLINQRESLRSLDIGHILPVDATASVAAQLQPIFQLSEAAADCKKMETFRFRCSHSNSKSAFCRQASVQNLDLLYSTALNGPWRRSLRRLSLAVPHTISATLFLENEHGWDDPERQADAEKSRNLVPPLEELELPMGHIDDPKTFARAMKGFPNLRTLDISGSTIEEDDMRVILDACSLLSKVDLTSCRGIDVRNRRNIFKAFD